MFQHRIDRADTARDMKKEAAMCAKGLCQSKPVRKAPDGYRGRYGGTHVCQPCYEDIVDHIRETGELP